MNENNGVRSEENIKITDGNKEFRWPQSGRQYMSHVSKGVELLVSFIVLNIQKLRQIYKVGQT